MTAQTIVIVGATGDLAGRMLFPSLYFLDSEGKLPEGFKIFGAARTPMALDAFVELVLDSVKTRAGRYFNEANWSKFAKRLAYHTLDADDPATFKALAEVMTDAGETIFYLSTSPSLYDLLSTNLREAGLVTPRCRVIVEKPIGRDLASSQVINDSLGRTFSEREIFRIDHYLGKETVQNLLAVRFANTLFEPL